MKKKKTGDLNTDMPDMVAVAAPQDEAEVVLPERGESVVFQPPVDMPKEIKVEVARQKAGGVPVQSLSSVVNSLIGLPLPEVRAKLEELKQARKIKDFKVVPMGIPLSSDPVPGRVQVIKDHADNVLDIVVG